MVPQHWVEVNEILAAAIELPLADQHSFVSSQCESRPELLAEVESLLRAYHASEGFIEPPTAVGCRIGPYRIVEQIGSGGMGAVFRATRDDGEVQKEVAVKLMTAGFELDQSLVRRFVSERQILADLEHINIARFLDGGIAASGAPYIVMEFVSGSPITGYSEQKKLDLAARIRLFLGLCEAVQFAHQRLVVHCDIKPANVLVTDDGIPKLLDFGVAKLLSATATSVPRTQTATRVFTPDYASPEQVRGEPLSTATDVYSLGVLLYELVAGKRPYDTSELSLDHTIQAICHEDPPVPGSVAKHPVPSDLDAIVLKAMAKEPSRRYASAREFGDDLQRHLQSQPVLARPRTIRYVVKKFVNRHRAGTAAAAAAAVVLMASAVGILWQRNIAIQERDRARRNFDNVRKLARSVIFDLYDKIEGLPGSTPVRRDLVANAIQYLDQLDTESGHADAGLQRELAQAYARIGDVQGNPAVSNLGDAKAALASYEKAVRLARAAHLSDERNEEALFTLATILRQRTTVHQMIRDVKAARTDLDEALVLSRRLMQANPAIEKNKFLYASILSSTATGASNVEERLRYAREARQLFEELLAAEPNDDRKARNAALINKVIGGQLLDAFRADEAFPYLQRAEELDLRRMAATPNSPGTMLDLSFDYSQSSAYFEQKREMTRAFEYAEKMLRVRRALAVADPKDTYKQDRLSYGLWHVGSMHLRQKNYPAALRYFEESASVARRNPAAESLRASAIAASVAGTGHALAGIGGQQARACAAFREADTYYRGLAAKTVLAGRDATVSRDLQEPLKACLAK